MENENKSLNLLIAEYQEIEHKIIESDGEVDSDLENLLNSNSENLDHKFNNYEKFIRYLHGQSDHLKNMESHYTKRRKIIEKSIDRLKRNLINAMRTTGSNSMKTSEFNFSLCKSEKWVINQDSIDEKIRHELIDNGLAEEVFKPSLSKIKAKYKLDESKPEWIDIQENEYIKVS